MKSDLENMLRQVADELRRLGDADQYVASVDQVCAHIRQVRASTATLDEFADLYMLRPKK